MSFKVNNLAGGRGATPGSGNTLAGLAMAADQIYLAHLIYPSPCCIFRFRSLHSNHSDQSITSLQLKHTHMGGGRTEC